MLTASHPRRHALRKATSSVRIEPLEDRRLLSAGDLDTTFGSGGAVNVDWEDLGESLVLSDGKILVSGTVAVPADEESGRTSSVVLARYNSDGSLDTTFGNAGVTTPLAFSDEVSIVSPSDLAVQSDGRIVLAISAHSFASSAITMRVTRFNSNGTLDTTFGGAGRDGDSVALLGSGHSGPQSLAIAPDNKIVVGSSGRTFVGSSAHYDFVIHRLNANGTTDTSFGNGRGVRRLDFGGANPSDDHLAGVALQGDGKIVAAGVSRLADDRGVYSAARLNPDGSYDNLFHGGHAYIVDSQFTPHVSTTGLFVPTDVSANMMLLPDGRVQVMAIDGDNGNPELRAARFTNRGSADTSFGSAGIAATGQNFQPNDAEMQADGKIILSGGRVNQQDGWFGAYINPATDMLRMNTNGQIDSTFQLDPSLKGKFGWMNEFSLQPDQKIVAAMTLFDSSNEASHKLVRLLNDGTQPPPPPPPPPGSAGTLDPTFGSGGIVDTGFAIAESLVLNDGKILVVGTNKDSSGTTLNDVIVARFNSSGTLDTTFGNSGVSTPIVRQNQDETLRPLDIALQADGRIVVALGTNYTTRLTRYNADGTLDTSFGGSLRQNDSVAVSGAGFGGVQSLAISPDNKIIVGTSSDGRGQDLNGSFDFIISRLNADGTPDSSFGNGASFRRIDFGGAQRSNDLMAGIALDGSKIVAAGVTTLSDGRSGYAAARLNPDGTYDNLFHGGHAYILDANLTPSLEWHQIPNVIFHGPAGPLSAVMGLTADGRVEVAALSQKNTPPELRAARFTNRGSADTSFGSGGIAGTGLNLRPVDAELQADGKLLISGGRVNRRSAFHGGWEESRLDMLRLNQNGQVDSTFKMDATLAGQLGATRGFSLQPDQKIVAAAATQDSQGTHDKLLRLLSDNTPPPPPPPPTTTQKPFRWPFGEREIIQAEWFDHGGEGVAYHDDTPGNQGMGRNEGVDTFAANSLLDGNLVVVPNQGEWIEYTIRSPFTTTRNFNLQTRYATPDAGGTLNYYIDGTKVGTVTLSSTGSASNYQNTNTTIAIPAGTHVLRVEVASGGTNIAALDWFRFVTI
jgi:uncharacterized delta-60 repeat protein